jgi:uncharacterized protein YndB with AHSA1/START domain
MPRQPVNSLDIAQEVKINADHNRVFQALTTQVASWWGAPYLYSELAKDIVLELKLGGRFYEVWGEDDGALWGIVTQIKRNEWLEITGPIGMSGVVHGVLCYELKAQGAGTIVRLSHKAIGQISSKTRSGYSYGWKDLLGTRLKAFVETGKKYGVGCELPPNFPRHGSTHSE